MKRVLLIGIYVSFLLERIKCQVVKADCECDKPLNKLRSHSPHRLLHENTNVKFMSTSVTGEAFTGRPQEPSPSAYMHFPYTAYTPHLTVQDGCKSEQVHITLGDDAFSMIVSFVSWNYNTKPEVRKSGLPYCSYRYIMITGTSEKHITSLNRSVSRPISLQNILNCNVLTRSVQY